MKMLSGFFGFSGFGAHGICFPTSELNIAMDATACMKVLVDWFCTTFNSSSVIR